MSENPYASPLIYEAELVAQQSQPVSLRKLQQINRALRNAQIAFLGCCTGFLLSTFGPESAQFLAGLILACGMIALWIFVSELACVAYGVYGGLISAFLFMIPLVNIFVLLAVHDRAVRVLKSHGYAKGFLQMKPANTDTNPEYWQDSHSVMVTATRPARSTVEKSITCSIIIALLAMIACNIL